MSFGKQLFYPVGDEWTRSASVRNLRKKNSTMRIIFTAFLLLIQTLRCLALDAKVDWHVHPTTGAYYQLNTQSALTWPQAETSCQQQGASLLSITDPHEQAYVTALLGSGSNKLWTGLILDPGHGWKWSNGRPYRYMKWDSGHPLPDPGHNCAMIAPAVHYNWQSFPCSRKLGYICYSKAREVVPTKAAEAGFCSSPWIPYNGHCFYLNHTLKMWPDAQRDCRNRGGDLASIHSVEDQSFVNSRLGFASTDELWIGLNDRKTEKLFDWADHSTVSFTSWEFGKPAVSTDIKDCVLIRGETGNWADRVCEEKHGFICMKLSSTTATGDEVEKYVYKHLEKRAVVTPGPPIPTTPPKCPPQWNKFRRRNYCYKLFSQSPSGRTWHEARDYCKTIGGDLLSIHSEDDLILIQLIRNHGRAWIGLSAPDPSTGYVWSDGSPLQFQHWEDDEPNNKNNLESCVQLTFLNFYSRGSWSDVHCDKGLQWLCQIQKGLTPNPPPDPIPAAYNLTSDGWLEWNGNQYYIGERRSLAMDDARYFCKKKHGDLVTINSEAESVFLWKQIKSLSRSFWIGLTVDLDRTYGWMDGSPVVFLRWDEGQPRFEYNDENCALMTNSKGLWHNSNCGLEHGFICKRNGTPPAHATVPPSVPPKGGCPLKWKKMNSMCYIINEQRKTWEEARTQCKSMGGNLASINSRHVQVFLTTSMAEAPNTDLWIGLHGKDQYQSYWTDGRPKRYDDWNFKQQTSHFGHQGYQPRFCVVMTSDTEQLGKWTLKSCNDTNGYICLRNVDPSLPNSPEPTTTNYVHIFNDSVKVVTTRMSWYAAQKHCKEDGATLASLRNIWSKKYVDLVTLNLNAPVWIGINSVETGGYFRYTEGWDLTSTYWSSGEPKSNRPCVYVDVDGQWRTSDCDTTIASVCMKSTDVPPTESPDFPGICPDVPEQPQSRRQLHSWLPFKGNCYLFLVERHNWPDASVNCAKNGGSLVSIDEPSEQDFIHSKVKGYKDTYMHSGMFFWIGLYKTHRGQWLWLDKAAMDYTNWNSGEPHEGSYGGMRINDGRWISTRTTYGSGYICKTPKVLIQAPTTATSPVVNPGDKTH